MVKPSVFHQSPVNYFQQTDLKACLEIRRPKDISKNKIDKESADSKYRENILYQVTLLVFSPKPRITKR